MYSLLQHPFIIYTFVLSSTLAVLTAIVLRLASPRGVHRTWVYMVPLVVPVLSYVINYIIIGKTCGFSHSYIGALRGFPSYHFFCRINYRIIPWIAPASLTWLAVSVAIYGIALYRTHWLLKCLPSTSEGSMRPKAILDELCRQVGMKPPVLKVLDYPQPLMFIGGIGRRALVLSTGTLELLEDDELRAALAHELVHIRRMGHILNWFFMLCRDLTLFSPASLWSYAALRNNEEEICDALAASQTRLGVELASAIVKFMRHGNRTALASLAPSLLPGGNPGVARVKHLLDASNTDNRHSSWPCALLIILLIGLVFIC
ncbi:MAG: M48 family metalloprotease [Firmicutes bacterium]|nr:M48 family metalloprotease [Bacillota bacterium]